MKEIKKEKSQKQKRRPKKSERLFKIPDRTHATGAV
jgi:hypothetical protein